MTSLVQRFGRAARREDINGRAILYCPPVTNKTLKDPKVREFLLHNVDKKCLWEFIDKTFGNEPRACDKNCSGCDPVKLPASLLNLVVAKQQIRGRWPKRSKEEKALALQELLLWRKKAFKTYQGTKRYPNGAETGILPDKTAKEMSQQFSKLRTADAVETFASTNGWCPRGNPETWFLEIAQLLAQLNKDIDGRLLSSGSPIVDLALAPPNGGSDNDENDGGSSDEEDD